MRWMLFEYTKTDLANKLIDAAGLLPATCTPIVVFTPETLEAGIDLQGYVPGIKLSQGSGGVINPDPNVSFLAHFLHTDGWIRVREAIKGFADSLIYIDAETAFGSIWRDGSVGDDWVDDFEKCLHLVHPTMSYIWWPYLESNNANVREQFVRMADTVDKSLNAVFPHRGHGYPSKVVDYWWLPKDKHPTMPIYYFNDYGWGVDAISSGLSTVPSCFYAPTARGIWWKECAEALT